MEIIITLSPLAAAVYILAVASLLCAVATHLSLGEDRRERDERKGGPWGAQR